MAVGIKGFCNPVYSSFVIGVRAYKTWLADTDGNHVVLRVFNDKKRRCDGNEFYPIFRQIFYNRTANI